MEIEEKLVLFIISLSHREHLSLLNGHFFENNIINNSQTYTQDTDI